MSQREKRKPAKPTPPLANGSLARLVRRAVLNYCEATLAYNRDCNLRHLKRPDDQRRKLRAESERTFEELMTILKADAPNGGVER